MTDIKKGNTEGDELDLDGLSFDLDAFLQEMMAGEKDYFDQVSTSSQPAGSADDSISSPKSKASKERTAGQGRKINGKTAERTRHSVDASRSKVRSKSLPQSGKRKTSRRKRQARRRKIVLTILLVAVLAAAVSVGGYMIYSLRGGNFDYLAVPYKTSTEFAGSVDGKENLRGQPFAAKLCVVNGNISYGGINLPPGQKGLLLNLTEQKAIYAQDCYLKSYPASITKLVTAIIAFEYGNMGDLVTIKAEDLDLDIYSQVCGFRAGDKLTMDQLIHCLLVYSGNDAAMAIADHVGGSIPAFVDMMNQYARKLGCTGTHFANPHGLQDENHYTTPYDIYLILKEAAKFPEFTDISQLSAYTVEYTRSDGTVMRTLLEATDHYLTGEAVLPKNVTILGGKTGYTNEAGNCLALLSQNAYGQPFVSIVMGAPEKEDLYNQMNLLLQVIND